MRGFLSSFLLAALAVTVILWLGAGEVRAQTPSAVQEEADTLLERIRAAKAKSEGASAQDTGIDLSTPSERKKKAAEKDTEDTAERRRTPARTITDPYAYTRSMTLGSGLGARDVLQRYELGTSSQQLLGRIRGSRPSEEKPRDEATTESPRPETTTPERPFFDRPTGLRDYRHLAPDYHLESRYSTDVSRTTELLGGSDLARSSARDELPDPKKDFDTYQAILKKELGARGQVSRYADPNLRGTYETKRFGNLLSEQYDVDIDLKRQDAASAYSTYRQFQRLPDVSTQLGKRDTYIPYSTNYLSSTYRGTIYDTSSSSDLLSSRSVASPTYSRLSNLNYFNLNTRESYADYYEREYGVSRSFLPGSSARHYDLNTMKQWSAQLNRDYGVDVRAGSQTYADLYRLHTSKPGY